ncbi:MULTISPECIES: hypothetical protein [Haloferax]|uniref:Lipoprotein n=1 Tax=Haloferax marinum TaxID=2666143 RepID=A0A6A8G8E1_9EURY|nr:MULTISPECIES: hypothetical protein [Haloferax]KAB1198077.1 hypothetical protein Hfx1150_11310 [Haloferax sp. CBA1150]MRW97147.1 hypothetical protein [Haloferax marinum]
MKRRTLLQSAVPAALISLAGCSAVKCRIDGNYDKLTLESLPKPEPETSITIDYSNLSSSSQNTVDEAIRKGSINRCHDFSGEGTAIEKLWKHISAEWETVGETDFDKIDRTFLKKGSEHFGIIIFILDVGRVGSIPYNPDDS